MNKPEILAPAGSFESLLAAVYCKADAVYLGAKGFNARRNADNFDEDDLRRAVEFCHERDTLVYQTLNILMLPGEEDELLKTIETACELGIDGVMVQDLGVLSILKKTAPQLNLYASTQLAVHNLNGVLEAAKMGFNRVVLAREVSKGEIEHIIKNSPIGIEIFVHGALCMSVSGQCYLSSMLGGRSGNRGLCAQPCRLPFELGSDSHALSLKDLSLVDRVGELSAMGVSSLKIEGRMKRPEYVAAAVTAVRMALDGEKADMDALQKVFSRSGFTSGYYDKTLNRSMFGIRQRDDVIAATDVLKTLAPLTTHEQPRVPLFASFVATPDSPMTLKVWDNKGNKAEFVGEIPEIAINKATDEERLLQSLQKTGGTPYYFENIDITLGEGLMLKASQLNLLRREVVEQISYARQKITPLPFNPQTILPQPPETMSGVPIMVSRLSKNQLSAEAISLTDELILPPDAIEKAIELGARADSIMIEIPRISFDDDIDFTSQMKFAASQGVNKAWAGNIGAIHLAREFDMEVTGGWSLNVTNSHSVTTLQELGVEWCEVSFECSINAAKSIGGINKGAVVYGYLPLMTFRNCPVRSRIGCDVCKGNSKLKDRKNIEFSIHCRDKKCSELLNSVPLYLADRIEEFRSFDFVTLWFSVESAQECINVLQEYKGKKLAQPSDKGHTRGLYYRSIN